ncbi:hypothetical protein FPV67DRAFT_1671955 [Lyophyllum atratum]|nr:hypothetical protein FPV67DRAFT_1671955 [Lyophyllum atratum]
MASQGAENDRTSQTNNDPQGPATLHNPPQYPPPTYFPSSVDSLPVYSRYEPRPAFEFVEYESPNAGAGAALPQSLNHNGFGGVIVRHIGISSCPIFIPMVCHRRPEEERFRQQDVKWLKRWMHGLLAVCCIVGIFALVVFLAKRHHE